MLFGVPIESLLTILGATFAGFVIHVLMKVSDIRENDDSSMTLFRYFAQVPYKTLAKLMTVLGSTVLLAAPEVTPAAFVGAMGIGYAADSATNRLKAPSL